MQIVRQRPLRVAVAGLGAIGLAVARQIDAGIDGLVLAGVSARDRTKAREKLSAFCDPPPLCTLDELADRADIIVEALPGAAFRAVAVPVLERGKVLVAISSAALLDAEDLPALARRHGGRILLPAGAMMGLDALTAMAEGEIVSVTLISRKPPQGLKGAPYLEENGIRLDGLAEPLCVFRGSARAAARAFPANVNVAATLSLAGIGPDATMVEVWADPALARNTHAIEVVSDIALLTARIENLPMLDNPRSSRITAASIVSCLRRLVSPLCINA
ncbi:MAG: aspartate dehydrogenase [Alphaproteobacteria bacterium]|nr:aspartate dehydrogenase [Alphaproteobacteria bacterium]